VAKFRQAVVEKLERDKDKLTACICSHDTGHMWEASSPQPVLAGLMRL